jgi:hypothetical protein
MMLGDKSEINAGDQSTNNQAQTINNSYGLSYADVRDIATDIFKSNIVQFSETAAALAQERASEMTEKFLYKLEKEAPEAINEFATPGMQDTYFQAQKEYAINGDAEIADMLVEMLVERAKLPARNRLRLALDEGLKVAPKLTVQQMDLLTLSHFRFHSLWNKPLNFESLVQAINPEFMLVDDINILDVDEELSILEYFRLGKISSTITYKTTEEVLLETYPQFLNRGFTLEECHVPEFLVHELFIPCFHNAQKYQFKFASKDSLISFLREKGITEERILHISNFFNSHLFEASELPDLLKPYIPNYHKLDLMYNTTSWKQFSISKIGMAIAISNYHRRFGIRTDLSVWVK